MVNMGIFSVTTNGRRRPKNNFPKRTLIMLTHLKIAKFEILIRMVR